MHLREALGVRKGEIIALVGAGGKTTAMYRLGRELADQGWRVVATTTTMIRPPAAGQTEALVVHSDPAHTLHLAAQALRDNHLITLASERLVAKNKLRGVKPDLVASLLDLADAVIIEADGAKGRSLKAPAAHEPVVPPETTLFVPVVGIDAVGRPLTDETVHRAQLVSGLTGLACGEAIHTSALACLLTHKQGALKGAPVHARVAPLINKADDEAALAIARQIACSIKGDPALDRVLIGSVTSDDPIVECWRRVSAVVLAAGAATRFGLPKQLVDVGGTTMIEHILHVVQRAGVDEVVVVLGHKAAQVARHIPSWCRIALNQRWQEGVSTSIQAGLDATSGPAQAVLFIVADQPYLRSGEIDRLLWAYYGHTKAVVVPVYQGRRGNPVLFDRSLFPLLRDLSGDSGGRQVMERLPQQVLTVEMPSPEMFVDIDTQADYEEYLRMREG